MQSGRFSSYVYGMYSMGIWRTFNLTPWRLKKKVRAEMNDLNSRGRDGDTVSACDRERSRSKDFQIARKLPNTLTVPRCYTVRSPKFSTESQCSLDVIKEDEKTDV